jgi:hypothetical protein
MEQMFLTLLNDRQKTAFLALAGRVIRSDARLSLDENGLRDLINREMGLPRDLAIQPAEIKDVVKEFDSRNPRIAVLLELLGLAYSNGDCSKESKRMIEQIAAEFAVSDSELLAMENWALRQLALACEATEFFSQKEGD